MEIEIFNTLAEAQERVRALSLDGGKYEIQRQPKFAIPTHPRMEQEFYPERFLVFQLDSSR